MRRNIVLISISLILILSSFKIKAQQTTLYHKIRFTASSVVLVEWNTTDTINASYVKELVDKLGRTTELRFYNNYNKLYWTGSGFYGGPIFRFDYEKGKIIETYFSSDNEIANDFKKSEVPYRHIYFLDNQNHIMDIKQFYKIDFEWTKESFENTIEHLEFYKQFPDEGSVLNNVFGYDYSFAKMNGINPIRRK